MELIVQTIKGQVKGFETEGTNAWFGIPFAKAPVGELRFKRAQPADPWDGIKDCSVPGHDPVQFIAARETEDEDCLNINVWAPKGAGNLPVMVWFYGGGLHYGFNTDPSYDGTHMAANGVIRVNVNSRLGPLGYYDFSQFDPSFDTNCALSDQIESLKWVRDNIQAFGGDPGNVTIFGESGGGVVIFNLLTSPAAKGLFQKAIAQSGLPRLSVGGEFSRQLITRFLEYMNLKPDDVYQLKTMDIAQIKAAGSWFYNNFMTMYAGISMPGPLYGDDLLPEQPWKAFANGSAEDVNVILGYNRDEGDTFIQSSEVSNAWIPDWETVEQMLLNNGKGHLFAELRAAYSDIADDRKALSSFARDYLFAMDTYHFADIQTSHGNVWMYRFDFVPMANKFMNMGATHAAEVPFALDTLDRGYFAYILQGTPSDQAQAIRDQINGAWLNFAKTGKPADGVAIEWPKYEGKNSPVHIFDLQPDNRDVRLSEKIFAVWEKIGLVHEK